MKQQVVKQSSARRYARTALGLALALASGAASALGLGQIEVKSRLGQPFLAEIPIVSSDPGELENLQAELASPLVFARIGLQPPMGVVAELRFASALDAAGRPVIRVTSEQPVNEPLLTFLVSVDWGQGRLVREYAALVDAPRTVSAPLQPQIEETVVSAPNIIERPVEPAPPAPEPEAIPDETAADAVAEQGESNDVAPTPQPQAEPVPEAQVAIATPPREPVPEASEALSGQVAVKRGDTLSQIAGRMQGEGFTLDQTMIALLRANPDAFIGGNINRLKAGAVLDMPAGDQLASVDAGQARRLVASQIQQWRDARRAVPQPALEGGVVASAATGVAATAPTTGAVAGSGAGSADARLEIVPPGASRATQAGTQSGIQADGEGEMLRQELQQTQETVVAREAEVTELKSRVAELEQLQQKQQQLIAMKDSELAAAQQRLAKSNQEAQAAEAGGSALPWAIGGGALLLALLGGWLWRRRPAKAVFRAPSERAPAEAATPSIADAFAAEPMFDAPPPEPLEARNEEEPSFEAPFELSPQPSASKPAAPRPAAASAPAAPIAPAWHVAAADKGPRRGQVEPTLAMQPGQERLELARAYLDLGDHESARQLLSEVVINGDLVARQQASRMLQELE